MGHREISQNLTVPHMSGHISTTYLQLLMVASSGLLLQLKRKNNNSKTEERAVQVTQTSRNSRFPLTIALVTSVSNFRKQLSQIKDILPSVKHKNL